MSFRKLLSIFLAMLILTSAITVASAATVSQQATGADTVYVDATATDVDGQDYWAWIWNTGSTGSWYSMSKDTNSGYYTVSMDPGQEVVFARVAPGNIPDWDNSTIMWTQSEDLKYDGTQNLCTLSWGDDTNGQKMRGFWSSYNNPDPQPTTQTPQPTTQAPQPTTQTPQPTTQTPQPTTQTPQPTTSPQPTTNPIPTDPKEADEDQYLYVSAKSNVNTTGVKTKVLGNTITVSYSLTVPELIDNGHVSLSYDTSKLNLSTVYNTASSMFPVVKDAVYNLNAGIGLIMFDFSNSGTKYDFTSGATLVTLVFEKKTTTTVGTASVFMDITDLNSKDTTYIEDGTIKNSNGLSVNQVVNEQEVIEPTEENVPTDAENNITVNVSSNINTNITSVNAQKTHVRVTYHLTVPEMVAFGKASVVFDSDKLALEDKYNTPQTMFSTLSDGVSYNLHAGTGTMKFTFTGIASDKQTGLYNFKDGGVLVSLSFTIRSGSTGSANVYLNLDDLGTFDKDYVSNGVISGNDINSAAEAVDENSTAPTGGSSENTSDSSNTNPSYTTPTESNTPTQKPTTPPSKTPSLEKKSLSKSAGSTYKIVVKNAGGKKISYKSNNEKILKVSSKGKVTFLKKGNSTVTVKVGSTKLTFKGKVTSDPKLTYKNKTVKASKTYKVNKGKTITIKIKGKASALKNKYKSTKIAKIKGKRTASKIKIKGLKKGKTTIKITVNRYKTLKMKIKVK